MHFWADYGLYLAKITTTVVAILFLLIAILAVTRKGKSGDRNKLNVKKLNKKYQELASTLQAEILSKKEFKHQLKQQKQTEKKQGKLTDESSKRHLFVLQFNGDIKASAVASLREEITAILNVATPRDEVVVRLESSGGLVSAYGLAASQLQRLKKKNIPLTVTIDKIAASGGYMMACVADRILAAPFAIIGSIGVVAQIPNFHRFLKNKDIDFEQLTAGEYKRTLTLFGENTEKARIKFQEELEEVHVLFKDFIQQNRPGVNIQQIATGEHWLAKKAHELNLVDELITSDDYLLTASQGADVYQINYSTKKSLGEKFGLATNHVLGWLSTKMI